MPEESWVEERRGEEVRGGDRLIIVIMGSRTSSSGRGQTPSTTFGQTETCW